MSFCLNLHEDCKSDKLIDYNLIKNEVNSEE